MMSAHTPDFAETPLFTASLTPYRSLSPRGRRIVIALVAVMCSIPGIVFFALGAWPILGFMGLDVLAVWWALSASNRSGRQVEHVVLYPDALEIRQVSETGREQTSRFELFFTQFVVLRDGDRVTGLLLKSRERSLRLGTFLNPDDKASFAKVFAAALARAKG
jgi:uncharacterized membrane protein